jgi:hypothetical protein
MRDDPVYISKPSAMSFWSEYRIYIDRLELDTRLFGLITVHFSHLERFEVRPPVAVLDLMRDDHGLTMTHRSLKLDLVDLSEHVAIERDTGIFRQLRLTPEDPEAFVHALRAAYDAWSTSD